MGEATPHDNSPYGPRRPVPRRSASPVAVALVGLGLLFSACGTGSTTPGVASLGSTTTTAPASGAQAASKATNYADAVKYAHCMRTHGVPNMPDPNSNGDFLFSGGRLDGAANIDPSSSQYKKADKACSHLLPNGGQMTPAEEQQALSKMLKFVQCLRTHGVPTMPDPIVRNGGIALHGPAGIGPNSPQLQAAQRACRSLAPGF